MASAAPPPMAPTSPTKYLRSITIRNPPYTYLHLLLLPPPSSQNQQPQPPDILTLRLHLASALNQFLGLTGTAIPIDVLKMEGWECWVRVPREDARGVVGALGMWNGRDGVAWRVSGRGEWLGSVAAGGGGEVFEG